MEGESLFNDATSIVLFEIFFEMVKKLGEGSATMEGGLLQEGLHIILQIGWLAVGDSFFFLLLLLLPPPSSSSCTSSPFLAGALECNWQTGNWTQGRLNSARDCTHCLSDQLPCGEMQLISGGQYSIQDCASGIGVLTKQQCSDNKWVHYSAFLTDLL